MTADLRRSILNAVAQDEGNVAARMAESRQYAFAKQQRLQLAQEATFVFSGNQ